MELRSLNQVGRYCAYCLIFLATKEEIKLCGKCHRRAYCSRECQTKDWSLEKGKGQGHKNWCNMNIGEEDIDWEVVSMKYVNGLGVIAKRDLPVGFRLMAERLLKHPEDHPAVMDLAPTGGTAYDKFTMNRLGVPDAAGGEGGIGLRLSRVNHSCASNCEHTYLDDFDVKTLVSYRPIKQGEEITISYTSFGDPSGSLSVEVHHRILQMKWNITCPAACICHDVRYYERVKAMQVLDESIHKYCQERKGKALDYAEKLLEMHKEMSSPLTSQARTYYDTCQASWMMYEMTKNNSYRRKSKRYLQKAYDLTLLLFHPQSTHLNKYKEKLEWV